MKSQLGYFLACIALGLIAFVVYALMRLLAKKTKLVPVTIILDFIWCGLTFVSFLALNVWLKDGQPYFFAFCGTIGGFFLGMLLLSFVPKKHKSEEEKESIEHKNEKSNTDKTEKTEKSEKNNKIEKIKNNDKHITKNDNKHATKNTKVRKTLRKKVVTKNS